MWTPTQSSWVIGVAFLGSLFPSLFFHSTPGPTPPPTLTPALKRPGRWSSTCSLLLAGILVLARCHCPAPVREAPCGHAAVGKATFVLILLWNNINLLAAPPAGMCVMCLPAQSLMRQLIICLFCIKRGGGRISQTRRGAEDPWWSCPALACGSPVSQRDPDLQAPTPLSLKP